MLGYTDEVVTDRTWSPSARAALFFERILRRWFEHWAARDRNVFGLAVFLAVSTLSLAVWVVATDYRETRNRSETALENVVNALERDIARNIELYNLTLQETVESLRLPGLAETNPILRHAAMFDRIATADYMASVLVVDSAGTITDQSDSIVSSRGNVADRDYFSYLRDHSGDALYISSPLVSRATEQPILVFARRLSRPDGSFAGVVAGSVELSYFRQLFSTLDFGAGGSVALFRTDGLVLARIPSMPKQAHSIVGTPIFAAMSHQRSGVIDGVSAIDGVRRLYAYHRVGDLPLIVTVSYGRDAVFAGWLRKAVLILAAVSALVAIAFALLFSLRHQLARRVVAERNALASADLARRSERTLALSFHQLDAVFQFSADIQYAASPRADGQFAFDMFNRRGEEITGLRAEAMIGRTPDECLTGDSADLVLARWESCRQGRVPISYEHTMPMPSGRSHWETRLVPVHDADGVVCRLIGTTRDITDRKQTEQDLLTLNSDLERRAAAATAASDDALVRASAAERLQILGQLASGIAHDVNNVLQSVAGGAELVERRADEPHTTRRAARLIAAAAARGAAITHRLLAFSRDDGILSARILVAPLLDDLVEILRHTLPSTGPIDIVLQCDDPALTVFADHNQLQTVLLNLATNARDAMPQGGTLILGATSPGEMGRPDTLTPGDYVRFWVQDDGSGMDAATLARVTEPFFTTKPVGVGTGLGLSMADTYARESGGTLTIESQPGRGTTVELWLLR